MDSTTTPAQEAGDVAHAHATEQPAEDLTENGQAPEQSEDAEDESPEDAEKRSRSKERRDREKAAKARFREQAMAAEAEAAAKEERLRRIREAHLSEVAPQEKDYPDPIEHAAALAVWKMTRNSRTAEQQAAEQEAHEAKTRLDTIRQQERAALQVQWQSQMTEARSRYADFDDVVIRNTTVPVPQHVADLIVASDKGADLAYHICSRPELAADLAALPVIEAARQIGRIEAALSNPTKPRTETRAPPPINPVRSGAAPRVPDPDKDFDAWLSWRNGGGTYR
jgi:hypothetical protein